MAAIYRTLLDEIERDGFQVLTQRTSLTPLRKLWLAWKTCGIAAASARRRAPATPAWRPRSRSPRRGAQVTVFESGAVPGGRARRVERRRATTLDNGQHILIGAYTELSRLMRTGRRARGRACCACRSSCATPTASSFRAVSSLPPSACSPACCSRADCRGASASDAVRFMLALRKQRFRLAEDCSVSALLAAPCARTAASGTTCGSRCAFPR